MRHLAWIGALACLAALPWVAETLRGRAERCAFDGGNVAASYRVRISEPTGAIRSFCGVSCALAWLARHPGTLNGVFVCDCVSGREVTAREAWFVRSFSTWRSGAPDPIRVFARYADAKRHVDAYGGKVLVGAERPFRSLFP